MATSYSNFTYTDLDTLLVHYERQKLFPQAISGLESSNWLSETLAMNHSYPLGTEKAKSELLVIPILTEIRRRNHGFFALYSGYTFDVDATQGLTGRSDFILTKERRSPIITAPLFAVVEAKNDNVEDAVPQCIAQMLAAQIFNERKGTTVPVIYGAATSGFDWLFMRLSGNTALIDTEIYQIRALPELLGVLQNIIDFYKNLPE